MIQGFYSAVVGAQQQMQRMNVQANNIANVNTFGYKAEKPAFEALMYRAVDGIDGAELPRGSGSRMVATATDFREAAVEETGRPQDYAIAGDGFFALYDPATGEVTFTRDGSFMPAEYQVPSEEEEGAMESAYFLSDASGLQVLGRDGYPIRMTGDFSQAQPVGVFMIQYQDGLLHLDGGRFQTTAKSGAVYLQNSDVMQGYLETSNADLATEIGKVIEAQRSYSFALRMATTADEVESTINNLPNG